MFPIKQSLFGFLLALVLTTFAQSRLVTQRSKASPKNQLLLVSFDGFRWDYLTKFNLNLPNFARLRKSGVSIKNGGNIPPFFTYTFPSHYTTVTGLYEENHGIVGNTFYDPLYNETFKMYKPHNDPKWWNGGEPIWVTCRNQDLTSATYFWPGSGAEIRGVRPNFWKEYDGDIPFEVRVEEALDWLKQGINFVTVYFSEPDHMGHGHGPDSKEVADAVKRMDGILGLILDGLEKRNLTSKVNFLLTSDHGMENISPTRSISLKDYINIKDVYVTTDGPASFIWPKKPTNEKSIYKKLKDAHPNMTVYLKKDIPDRWHYKNNRRISPIYATADLGWWISGYRGFPMDRDSNYTKPLAGMHGYDNVHPSMHAIFFASGPDIAVNAQVEPFETVNYYLLMCRLLDLKPAPNNGTAAAIEGIIASAAVSEKEQWMTRWLRHWLAAVFVIFSQKIFS